MKIRETICILTLAAFSSTATAQDGLKIYISADMEGVVGAVTGEQLGPGGFEYETYRQFMTNEVNAAIDAARAAGRRQRRLPVLHTEAALEDSGPAAGARPRLGRGGHRGAHGRGGPRVRAPGYGRAGGELGGRWLGLVLDDQLQSSSRDHESGCNVGMGQVNVQRSDSIRHPPITVVSA